MKTKKISFRILRFKAGVIDPPRYVDYDLMIDQAMSVLEALEQIRIIQDPTLMYRHSCHHSSCGTCACRVNASERLLCTTNVWALDAETVTVAPLKGFPLIADLVVDMGPFFKDIDDDWSHLQPSTKADQSIVRFEDCIECGSCISACPVFDQKPHFLGPAVLAAIHREMGKTAKNNEALLNLAKTDRGVDLCDRALNCSRVCPTAVYPARHIFDLRKMIKN